jgi:phage-related protein
MAISGGDGSIVLTTKIDETGIEKGMSKLKSGIGAVGKAFALVGTAAAAGFVAISKSAVDSYAEYEQLKGGVETLFKDSADVLMGYADRAYQTAGLSANDYMATVTSFSASLLQSLGGDTAAAADYADQAIIDMSDNANKMGTSMEMIQNAYQGFAKQNYTMLDNLKLGYGGTKEEMQRLLDDAEKISGIKYDISSFADVTQAIHIIQTELGITGTTALESSSTIQGSASAMKSSWQNLLTGMADPTQNFEQLLQNFISSVGTFLGNLLPVFTTATQGVLQMVQGLLPQIPVLIEQMLPIVIEGVSGIIAGLVEVLPKLVDTVVGVLPQLIDAILNLLPMLLDAGLQIILSLAQGIIDALPELIPKAVDIILQITKTLLENLDQIIFAAIDIIVALATGLIDAIPELLEELPAIITSIVMFLTDPSMTFKLVEAAILIMAALIEGIIKSIPAILEGIAKVIPAMINGFKSSFENFKNIGKHLIDGLWQGIVNTKDWLLNKIKSFAKTITDGIKSFFGIHSPSTVFRDEIGKNLMLGLANGITGNEGVVSMAMSRVANGLSNTSFAMPNIVSGNILPYFTSAISSSGVSATENGVDSSSNGNIPINVQIMLDRRELGSAVVEVSQEEIRRTGGSLVKGARLVIA